MIIVTLPLCLCSYPKCCVVPERWPLGHGFGFILWQVLTLVRGHETWKRGTEADRIHFPAEE